MVDLVTLGLAALLFLGGFVGYILKRLSVFEIKERRKAQREKQEWYDKVERTVNGIEHAWTYSGLRPEEEDRERTIEEMNKFTDELKEHRRHQLATDEMVEKMNEIIHRWDDCRHLIHSLYSSHYYNMRAVYFEESTDALHEQLNRERQGSVRSFFSALVSKIRDGIERFRRWRYSRKSPPFSVEIYRALKSHLSDDEISKVADGESFLLVRQNYGLEAIHYDRTEDRYNPFHIDYDQDGEIVVIDKLEGLTNTESLLLPQLQDADAVDTKPDDDIVSDGQTIEEFEQSDSS